MSSTRGQRQTTRPAKYTDIPDSEGRKKRKLIDKLGPKWTEEELSIFFEEHKVHKQDWKKICSALPGRSPVNCEELFLLNKTLLSIPGITVDALIGVMADCYINNAKEWDSSEKETSTGTSEKGGRGTARGTPRKDSVGSARDAKKATRPRQAHKRSRALGDDGKPTPRTPSDSAISGHSKGIRTSGGRVVGRRTPRNKPSVDPMKEAAAALTSVAHDEPGSQPPASSKRSRSLFQEKSPPGMDEDDVLASLLALSSPPPSKKRTHSPVPFAGVGADGRGESASSKRRKGVSQRRVFKNAEEGGESGDVYLSPSAKRAAMLAASKVKTDADDDGGGASSSNGTGSAHGGADGGLRSLTSPRQGASGFLNRGEALLPAKMRAKKKSKHSFGSSPISVQLPMIGDMNVPGGDRLDFMSRSDRHKRAELRKLADTPQERLHHTLNPKLRRWCIYEWFYGAIDRPWFARNEFMEYLQHLGMDQVTRMTRTEWSLIRASLGRPRRLSLPFLREER
eukprot:CAMPEP_0118951764 /NCGR_PEP_ID=MMETSP1169-20130426/53689_1 /TAXON_ID=36882 /ORGANISM="Pyramimonas obovata, Strain CCMP722" /LENGTH=509 /DNA_ID=CAMNT_0006898895 /DNA_START=371 /DNA_END=1897 /DNA_ORIENTATION=-